MNDFQIISDSACDLPKSLTDQFNIKIVNFYFSFDDVNYKREHVDMTIQQYYEYIISNNAFAKTSLPSIQDYIDVFEPVLKEGKDIVCVCISSKFSGSSQSAVNAKNVLSDVYPDRKIVIIDSLHATGTQGLLVLEICRMKEAGFSIEEITQKIPALISSARINFSVDSLDYLAKGGRIGKASALAGSLLNIKPIIVLENGELFPVQKVRTHKKLIKTMAEKTANELKDDIDTYSLSFLRAATVDSSEELIEELKKYYPDMKYHYPAWHIGTTVGTHTGPTAFGVCYIKKYEFV